VTLSFCSTFAGIGGFDYGFERAGLTCVSQVEIDPHRQRILDQHWPNLLKGDDIVTVAASAIERPDLICGGFPCQDTSIAAPHRRGLAGSRSGHYYDFLRLIDEHLRLIEATTPRWVVIENTPGLLKSNGGRDMSAVVNGLAGIGYGWAYRVVDAGSVGSAQRRQRVLVVGHLGGDPRPAWNVLGDDDAGSSAAAPPAKRRGPGGPASASSPYGPSGILIWRKSARPRASLAKGGYETWVPAEFANTLTGFDGGAATRQTHLVLQNGRLRTLTHVEWERLMGFPDGWTAAVPASHRYQVLGDAMNVNQAEWLGRRLLAVDTALPMIGVAP
jgi:DNA (cytosine-5)-methyltransferase 1